MVKKVVLFVFVMLFFSCDVYPIVIRDVWGNPVKNKIPFKRIISLYGAHTENLFCLGLDKEIIGVGLHDNYPERARLKPKFSYHDGPEKFIGARPDLVLIRPMIFRGYRKLFLKLKDVGITVVSLQPVNLKEMLHYWKVLGILTGRVREARTMIQNFLKEINRIKKVISLIPIEKRKRVYLESIHRKFKTFANDSIAMFVLKTAGGVNVAEDAIRVRHTNIAYYSKEKILSHADEIEVYISQRGPMNNITVKDIEDEPGFKVIKAVREGRVYIIDEEILSRPTPRLILGIKKIASLLYPEMFKR